MFRRIVLFAVACAGLAACTTSVLETTTTVVTATTTTTAPPIASDSIVVATTDGSIVVYDQDATELVRFDATDGETYLQPTWLDEDTVVASRISENGNHALSAWSVDGRGNVWESAMDSVPFFFAPAPSRAVYVTTSLRNNPLGGLIAELIDTNGVATFLGDESPFYTSWSPSGEQIAINNPGDHLDIWEDGEMWTILDPADGYQTPVWLDRGLVIVRDVGDTRYLSVWNDLESEFEDIAIIEGSAAFVGEGHRIAIKTNGNSSEEPGGIQAGTRIQTVPTIPSNRLVTFDLDSGDIQTVTTEPTAMFQWDPAGERLLYAEASLDVGLAWSIWEDGASEELAEHRPNPQWIGELVPFFDQYAQSVQFWSASGDLVAFPALVDIEPVVIIYDITTGTETTIPDAVWMSWATNR